MFILDQMQGFSKHFSLDTAGHVSRNFSAKDKHKNTYTHKVQNVPLLTRIRHKGRFTHL